MRGKKIIVFLLISLPILLTGCDKQQKSTIESTAEQNASEGSPKEQPVEMAETPNGNNQQEQTLEEPQDTTTGKSVNYATITLKNYEGGAIANIRKGWRYRSIELIPRDYPTPGIEQFTLTFCMESKQIEFPPNHALQHYLVGPENLDEDNFRVNCQPKSGYIRCDALTQFDLYTEACYWKRNNGHSLFGVFMVEEYEIPSKNDQMVFFYDYDPAKKTMTPEPTITDMIEQRMQDFDKYTAHMPEKGKDIRISAYNCYYEEDSVEETEFTLKWDGNSFKWAK